MRVLTFALAMIGSVTVSGTANTQPAIIGRQPALAPLRVASSECKAMPVTAALRKDGVVSGTFVRDATGGRMVSLGMTAAGHPRILLVMISNDSGGPRHETEMVTVGFDTSGLVVSGSRVAMTVGVPARLNEDRRAGLLPSDTAQATALMRAVRACSRR